MEDLTTDRSSRSEGVVLNGVHFAALVLSNHLLLQARQICREYSFQPLTATRKAFRRPCLAVRDAKRDIYTLRYEAVNAMLLNVNF